MSRPPLTIEQLGRAGHVVILGADGSLTISPPPPDKVLEIARSWAESFLAELATLPACDRCRCRPSRTIVAYWGQRLCPPCASQAATAHDRAGSWPPQPRSAHR